MWTANQIAFAVSVAFQGAAEKAEELNRLDGALGDGDLGGTVTQCAVALESVGKANFEKVSDALSACAASIAETSGSSFATVAAVALIESARWAGDKASLGGADLQPILSTSIESILDLGQVRAGDKTVVDGLLAIDAALSVADGKLAPGAELQRSLEDAIVEFRSKVFRTGRGRIYGEAARGLDDPGMVALRYALGAVLAVRQNPRGSL